MGGNHRVRFARHLASYDREALAQKHIAASLAQKFSALAPHPLKRMFEAGCGTGFLTRNLPETETLFVNDLLEEARHYQPQRDGFEWMPGDAETLDFPCDLDAIVSASTVQWFADLPRFLRRAARALNEGGWLALTHFGPQNLHQIRALTGRGLRYPSLTEFRAMLECDYDILILEEERFDQTFSTPMEILRHLQHTGVTGLGDAPFRWTKQTLHDFEETYRRLYNRDENVILTWHVHYAVCKKKSLHHRH